MNWKGFNNQLELTYWFNCNLLPTAVVNIVWIDRTLVLFYRLTDKLHTDKGK